MPHQPTDSNSDFVNWCYRTILRRSPDRESLHHYVGVLDMKLMSRLRVLVDLLSCSEYESLHRSMEFVAPGHFYSAVPSVEDRQAYTNPRVPPWELPGIALNIEKQKGLLASLKVFHDECQFPENKREDFRYYFANPAYSWSDAILLYSMIRFLKPQRIVEVGSGYSSLATLDTVDRYFETKPTCTFIEPHPELLQSLLSEEDRRHHRILAQRLQDTDLSVFRDLAANDILFIDSTHVSKLSSDVNRIFFDILPSLQQGVVIHFHDIFWPFDYPTHWIREGRAWNEAYVLRAFLEYNTEFEILLFSDLLHLCHGEWIQAHLPLTRRDTGGCIWLRKHVIGESRPAL